MSKLREKLREILITKYSANPNVWMEVPETISAILQAFKEVVPKGRLRYRGCPEDEYVGFNQCRQEMLEELK